MAAPLKRPRPHAAEAVVVAVVYNNQSKAKPFLSRLASSRPSKKKKLVLVAAAALRLLYSSSLATSPVEGGAGGGGGGRCGRHPAGSPGHMDTPDRPRAGAAGAAAGFEDSPVFNFINNLSPIPPPKPLDSAHTVQLFKSSDLAPVSSIFASPHVNPSKEPKILIRDDSVQLSLESHSPSSVRTRTVTSSSFRLIKGRNIVSENCSITCQLTEASIDSSGNTSNPTSKPSQTIQHGVCSAESDKNQGVDGKTELTMSKECTDLEGLILDQSGPDIMDVSHPGEDVHENQLPEQNNDGFTGYNGDNMIATQPSSDMLTLAQPFEAQTQLMSDTLKTDNTCPYESFSNNGLSASYIQNSANEPHVYWSGTVEAATVDYTPQMLPGASQSQLASQMSNKLNDPSNYIQTEQNALPQHLRGTRRRSLFNEKTGAINKCVNKASDRRSVSSTTPKCKTISGDNSKPMRTPPCSLPGIGLHLNALATIPNDKLAPPDTQSTIKQPSNLPCPVGSSTPPSENIITEVFAQTTIVASMEESGHGSPKKKRHKFDNGDSTSCKRCNCKKSKCLKLYCECFAAGVYCSEPCSCQGCLNTPEHQETVLSTKEQIESRNPLAFAPKVIRTSEPAQEFGDYSNKTPASARHKRGCNCKKSSCLKKYCECYQGGVGCSISCRCEGCKNAFGRREGVAVLSAEESKQVAEEKNACVKEEQGEEDKQLVIYQAATDPAPAENVLTTPMILDCRPLACKPPPSSKKPKSSAKGHSSQPSSSQAPPKPDIMFSPFESYAEMVLGDSTPDIQNGNSSPQTSVKVVSPNKKRVSPPRMGTGLSPICKSGRKLILKSIPSFPSLGVDLNNEVPKTNTPAP
ncbi:hypothetical protein ACP4OV_023094 [Aristida adscensionis]